MFASRFFTPKYFARRYWPDLAASIVITYTAPTYLTTKRRGLIRISGMV